MKNTIADTVVRQVSTIHLDKLTTFWQEVCEGPTELKFSYKGCMLNPSKHRDVHFRTPPLTEMYFLGIDGLVQVEYDWLTNKTNARLYKKKQDV